jgi:hypothetical protein
MPIFRWAPGEYTIMPQILDPLSPDNAEPICCCYVNSTSQIQVARITNIHNWYFERVVFPGQRLLFDAPSHGYLEIHTGMMASAILSDKIPCQQLIVLGGDEPNPFFSAVAASKLEYAHN